MDRVTLDFENNMVEWDTNNYRGFESCPGLAERKDAILDAMGYHMWDVSDVIGALNSFINGKISPDELHDIFDAELELTQSLTFLPLRVKAIDVLHAAKETYENFGDEAYAKSKSNIFLKRCGIKPEYGPSHPITRETLHKIVRAVFDDKSEELFWFKLYSRLVMPE